MAYISAEDVKVIRNNLKKIFPSSLGWKFSVTRDNGTAVRVYVMSSPVFDGNTSLPSHPNYHPDDKWTEDQVRAGAVITDIVKLKWWDKCEPQIDHFQTAFYITLDVGKWDRPCELTRSGWTPEISEKLFEELKNG